MQQVKKLKAPTALWVMEEGVRISSQRMLQYCMWGLHPND